MSSSLEMYNEPNSSNMVDCWLCKKIYNRFKAVFSDPMKCEDVKRAMIIICNELRPEAVKSCIDFVKNSMSDIFSVVVATQNTKMCQDIGKCKRKTFFDIVIRAKIQM
jgi:hypothetical protein